MVRWQQYQLNQSEHIRIDCNRKNPNAVYTPMTMVPIVFPNSSLVIKTFRGGKPTGQENAYDAREVMKYLGPHIRVAQKKSHLLASR